MGEKITIITPDLAMRLREHADAGGVSFYPAECRYIASTLDRAVAERDRAREERDEALEALRWVAARERGRVGVSNMIDVTLLRKIDQLIFDLSPGGQPKEDTDA